MSRQRTNVNDVRFSLDRFPDLAVLAERAATNPDGRGGLVREVRRILRLGLHAEASGLTEAHLDALAQGRLALVDVEGGQAPVLAKQLRAAAPAAVRAPDLEQALAPPPAPASTPTAGVGKRLAQAVRPRVPEATTAEARPSVVEDPALAFLQ